jgi:hypothetical protein
MTQMLPLMMEHIVSIQTSVEFVTETVSLMAIAIVTETLSMSAEFVAELVLLTETVIVTETF